MSEASRSPPDSPVPVTSEEPALPDPTACWWSLCESSPDGIVVVDDTDRVVYANRSAGGDHNPAHRAIGADVCALVPGDPDSVRACLREARAARTARRLESQGPGRDGEPSWYETRCIPIKTTARTVTYVLLITVDVTGRKRAETMLAELPRIARFGSWEADYDNGALTRIRWSDELRGILGVAPGVEPTPEMYASMIHADDRERVLGATRVARAHGQTLLYEARFVRTDGETRALDCLAHVYGDGAGRLVRVVGTAIDVTERKRAEEERRALERKLEQTQRLESLGVLAGGVAHDFNNILTSVLGNASLLREIVLPDPAAEPLIEGIERSATRAADLCRHMLAYAGRGTLAVELIDVTALIEDTLDLLRASTGREARLRLTLGRGLPVVQADPTQIQQVLMNLVLNSSEALADGRGEITIATGVVRADGAYRDGQRFVPNLPEGAYVFIDVVDTGAGMDPETQARIFDPFFTTKFTGRGLGLASALGIARRHRGAFKVTSARGAGSTIRLHLPVAGPAQAPPRPAATARSAWQGRGRVLVIDDERTVGQTTAAMLKALGFEAEVFEEAELALERFRETGGGFEAVVLDMTMPHASGEDTFQALRTVRRDVPIVIMSGFSEADVRGGFGEAGASAFLPKPFTLAALRERLRRVLSHLPAND